MICFSDEVEFNIADWRRVSPLALDLCRGLLRKDAKYRISAQQLLNHAFINRSKEQPSSNPFSTIYSSLSVNLANFAKSSRLKRLALLCTARMITGTDEHSIERTKLLCQRFAELDADHSGTLSFEEIKAGVGGSASGADTLKWFKLADLNGDGHIDYTEFVALMSVDQGNCDYTILYFLP